MSNLLFLNTEKSQELRLQMLRAALKEKSPKTFRELRRSHKLRQFLLEQNWAMMEAYGADATRVVSRASEAGEKAKDWLQAERDINTALNQLTEQVIANFTEFSDPPSTTESNLES